MIDMPWSQTKPNHWFHITTKANDYHPCQIRINSGKKIMIVMECWKYIMHIEMSQMLALNNLKRSDIWLNQ